MTLMATEKPDISGLSLDMHVPNFTGGWTLKQAVDELKRRRLTRLLERDDAAISERVRLFERAVADGRTPTNGQVLAAYYVVVEDLLFAGRYGDNPTLNTRQYAARRAALNRLVFRKV
ncbi:hypothetical protein ACBJ59_36425 [Nonomuraea sp. MTCD27]|uniref:hypothetical protein n=1 Tax=Nonomuraea sp. MTCD27 TaxID=1676747 RepID=UPI0035C222C2